MHPPQQSTSASSRRRIILAFLLAACAPLAVSAAIWFAAPTDVSVLVVVLAILVAIASAVLVWRALRPTTDSPRFTRSPTRRGATALTFAATIFAFVIAGYLTPNGRWPTSVNAAVELVWSDFDAKSRKELAYLSENDLIELHFGLGMWIRNEMGLWGGNRWLLSDCDSRHPDDCSSVIVAALWKRARAELPLNERRALETLEERMARVRMDRFDFNEKPLREIAADINGAITEQLPEGDRFTIKVDPDVVDDRMSWRDPESFPLQEALSRFAANTHIKLTKVPPDLAFEPDLRDLAPDIPSGTRLQPLRMELNGFRTQRREIIFDEEVWRRTWRELEANNPTKSVAPKIDFGRQAVVIASLGSRAHDGYGIELEVLGADGDDAHLIIVEVTPGDGCAPKPTPTYVTSLYVIAAPIKSASFSESFETRSCEPAKAD